MNILSKRGEKQQERTVNRPAFKIRHRELSLACGGLRLTLKHPPPSASLTEAGSRSNPELTSMAMIMASLGSQLVLGIPDLCPLRLELLVGHYSHSAFVWILGV